MDSFYFRKNNAAFVETTKIKNQTHLFIPLNRLSEKWYKNLFQTFESMQLKTNDKLSKNKITMKAIVIPLLVAISLSRVIAEPVQIGATVPLVEGKTCAMQHWFCQKILRENQQ